MERQIRDILARVQGLIDRLEQQPMESSKSDLRALRVALNRMLRAAQERSAP